MVSFSNHITEQVSSSFHASESFADYVEQVRVFLAETSSIDLTRNLGMNSILSLLP